MNLSSRKTGQRYINQNNLQNHCCRPWEEKKYLPLQTWIISCQVVEESYQEKGECKIVLDFDVCPIVKGTKLFKLLKKIIVM